MAIQRAELDIERLSQWGEGVGQWDGRTVFVAGAFPGERVVVDVEQDGKVFRGALVARVRSSGARRPSACPVSEECGGCDWLELQDATQLAARQEILLSSLEHLGGFRRDELSVMAALPSSRQMGYRRRAVFHADKDGLGLFSRRTHRLVHMQRCPALVETLAELPATLSRELEDILRDLESVDVLSEGEQVAVALHLRTTIRPKHREVGERLLRRVGCRGVVLVPEAGSPELLGKPVLRTTAPLRPEVPLYLRPDAFSQANAEGGFLLVRAALEMLNVRGTEAALELYSGNGYFTFALAARAQSVLAVEGAPVSSALGQRSASEARLANVRFVQGDVSAVCKGLIQEKRRFDVLLADPPRPGAPDLGTWAQALGVRRVVHVACDAASLARDARALREHGFQPRGLRLVDMFPQTRHIEAVMAFEAGPGSV